MDDNFTRKIQDWLNRPSEERDYNEGAIMLLQLTNNQIQYNMIRHNPKGKGEFISGQLQKYLNFRLQKMTTTQVAAMETVVEKIVVAHGLNKETGGTSFAKGRRGDHEDLPDEIKALYVENASILQKMRELHMQLRSRSFENATCPDSERYPFLKELIDLDKRYHKNWQVYDSYTVGAEMAEQQLIEDGRMHEKNIYRQINLIRGRYAKNHSEELKKRLQSLYSELSNPTDKVSESLRSLGVIA